MANTKTTSVSRTDHSTTQIRHLSRPSKASKTSSKAPTSTKSPPKPPAKQFLSTEFVYDSSSDSDGSQDEQQDREHPLPHPEGVQDRQEASRQEGQEARQRHPPTPNQARFQAGHQAEEDSASSSAVSSSPGGAHHHPHSSQVSHQDGRRAAVIEATTDVRPAPPFKAPVDFVEVSDPSASPVITDLLQPSNLAGKKIWYITAPEDVPITFDNVDMSKLANGQPILSHQGRDYSLVTDKNTSKSSTQLMIPSNEGYTTIPSAISQVMRLQQVVRLPHAHSPDSQPPAEAQSSKLKRPQPAGLRMRYRPPGSGNYEAGKKKRRVDD